jgi:hypothetical protein
LTLERSSLVGPLAFVRDSSFLLKSALTIQKKATMTMKIHSGTTDNLLGALLEFRCL